MQTDGKLSDPGRKRSMDPASGPAIASVNPADAHPGKVHQKRERGRPSTSPLQHGVKCWTPD